MPDETYRIKVPGVEPEPTEPPMELEEQEEQPQGKTVWVGSDAAGGKADDGISDLFKSLDQDEIDEDIRDLTDVDAEVDIIDSDDDGTLDSLTEVSRADIMGDDEDISMETERKQSRRVSPTARRTVRIVPETGINFQR